MPEKSNLQAGKSGQQPFFNKTALAAIIGIAAVIVILLVYGVMQSTSGQGTVVPAQACTEKTLRYINNNLVSPGTSASLVSVTESHGMYEMKVAYLGQVMSVYTTQDCSSLFTRSIDMNAATGGSSSTQPVADPVKTERPVVDLYVMAFCPYGTQAETVMKPVVALLGSKADIRVRYITTTTGTTVASVYSLHGSKEVQEDLRQTCIIKKSPEKFWDYIGQFNDACYPQYQNADKFNACRENVTTALGIDTNAIETCANGEEGLALLNADEVLSNTVGASSSPTLVINGQVSRGLRTPEAYKQAICDRFVTAPGECSTVLSSVQGTASGNCG
ncbi:MAG: DsbA family protein [Methanoregula sp.]